MIFVTNNKLREHVDMNKMTVELLQEAFGLLVNHGKRHFLFTNIDDFEKECLNYAIEQGWDPDTTLVSYEEPLTTEEREERDARVAKEIAEDPDWDDIQIGYVDPKQVICSLYPNMTFEKFIGTINSVANLKAFL